MQTQSPISTGQKRKEVIEMDDGLSDLRSYKLRIANCELRGTPTHYALRTTCPVTNHNIQINQQLSEAIYHGNES